MSSSHAAWSTLQVSLQLTARAYSSGNSNTGRSAVEQKPDDTRMSFQITFISINFAAENLRMTSFVGRKRSKHDFEANLDFLLQLHGRTVSISGGK